MLNVLPEVNDIVSRTCASEQTTLMTRFKELREMQLQQQQLLIQQQQQQLEQLRMEQQRVHEMLIVQQVQANASIDSVSPHKGGVYTLIN